MLNKLAKKDKLWREIAFKICKDRTFADDIVNEMYLRRHDNNRGQELTDYYIVCTMNSIYHNYKKTNKLIPVGEIRTDATTNGKFEPNDKEYVLLQRAKQLPFAKRELISLNYDYSLREIQQKFGINYGYVHGVIKEARAEILKDEIHLYQNKRLKYKKMSQSIGLGDTLAKVFKRSGIKKAVKFVFGNDCGCDERQDYLNEHFRYKLKAKCLTPEEIKDYENFILTRKMELTDNGKATGKFELKELIFIYDFFNIVFGIKYELPSCTSCSGTVKKIIDMVYKLDTVFLVNAPNEIKEQEPIKRAINTNGQHKPRNGKKQTRKRTTRKK